MVNYKAPNATESEIYVQGYHFASAVVIDTAGLEQTINQELYISYEIV